MPCVQAEQAEAQRRYIEAHRVDVDRFAGLTDPVERILRAHEPVPHDPLVRYLPPPATLPAMYEDLGPEDVRRLIGIGARFAADLSPLAEPIAAALACFTMADLEPIQLALIRRRVPYPGVAFRNACDRVVAELASLLAAPDLQRLLASHALEALAWTQSPAATRLFRGWRSSSPAWARALHVPPERYAHAGGWELAADGARRDLVGEPCHALIAVRPNATNETLAVVPTEQRCRCGRLLTLLFDIRSTHAHVPWVRWPGDRLVVPMCDACVCFETQFYEVTDAGEFAEAGERTRRPPADAATWPELPRQGLCLGPKRSRFVAARVWLQASQSQIGGHPGWIQHAELPTCPTCSRTMCFVGQVAHDEIEAHAEGTFYGFACGSCRIVAAGYQQT